MSILDEARIEPEEMNTTPEPEVLEQQPQYRAADFMPDLSFLKAETGAGTIDDYVGHVLNPKGSRGIAQMLRGFTGICGSLNYAVIDITLGAFEVMKEGKVQHEQPTAYSEQ